MNVAGNLIQSIGDGIAGLVGGAFRALGDAAEGVLHALGSALPGYWLPAVVIAGLALFAWALFER
ncbi:MAG: hypothetical protein ABIQ17_06275 [Candidatus Limnocylindrales bacterium]